MVTSQNTLSHPSFLPGKQHLMLKQHWALILNDVYVHCRNVQFSFTSKTLFDQHVLCRKSGLFWITATSQLFDQRMPGSRSLFVNLLVVTFWTFFVPCCNSIEYLIPTLGVLFRVVLIGEAWWFFDKHGIRLKESATFWNW